MATGQSKEIPKASPLGCIIAHWKDLSGQGGTESKRDLIKFCKNWWPLYKLDEGAKWPPSGTLDYDTLLQLMLFLRREGKWTEVAYADMFFSLRNHPEWQRDCRLRVPSDPLVLALEKKETKRGKLKRCCSACSIGQRCTKSDKVYQTVAQEQDLADDLLRSPHIRQGGDEDEDADSEAPSAPVHSSPPIAHRTRQQKPIIQAPLREAVGPEGERILVKSPFSSIDLEAWEKVAKNYRSDPVNTANHLRCIIKQHNPDWNDMQLLLDALTETERQLIIKTAGDLAEDFYRIQQLDAKEYFPLQNPQWDPNRSAELKKLESYREWIAKGKGHSQNYKLVSIV
uniref:Core shell protein Gag P30 domain-containing protein n=1 Tax=Catharus ustulatus TaxID=91951 RepID=A0A8C3UCP0_CATUS